MLKTKNQMKKLSIIISIIVGFTINSYSQNDLPKAKIKVFARYENAKGMQLVFIADQKNIVVNAMKNGFIIERAEANSQNFVKIAERKAYSDKQWKALIENEKNKNRQEKLKAGYAFYKAQTEIHSKSLNLQNGLSDLIKAKKDEDMRFLIMLLFAVKEQAVMNALGLTYTDTNVQAEKTYKYRVKLAIPDEIYQIESPVFVVKATKNNPEYRHLFYVNQGEKKLSFIWNEIQGLQAFDIERYDKRKAKFVKLNKAPIYAASANQKYVYTYEDKHLINYKKYTYRFYAHNFFGERIKLFEMTSFPIDKTPPPAPDLQKPEHIKPNEALLTWKMKNKPKDLKGFVVARSSKNKGKFDILHQKLLPPSQRKFIDKNFNKNTDNYYVVQAIDTANNISSSAPFMLVVIDTVPPLKPVFEKATIDSLGHILIKIKPGKEQDLMGYRLFKANSPKHEFSAIKEHFADSSSQSVKKLLVFKDTTTLNTLTPYIYYKVKALDFHYNQSEFSEVLKIKRPDTIPPVTPVFTDVKVYSNKVVLQFSFGQNEEQVSRYIYKKSALNNEWKLLSDLKPEQTRYIDDDVQQEVKYFYSLRAKDNSNIYSKYAKAVFAIPFDDKILPEISKFVVKQDNHKVKLSWQYNYSSKKIFFIIYKNDESGNLVQYKRIENTQFTDTFVSKGSYTYAVKAFSSDGSESQMSQTKNIQLK